MARTAISLFVFAFLYILSLSGARDLHAHETTTFPHNKPQQHDTVLLTLDSIEPLPLPLHDFRPVNRHIHPRRSLPLPLLLSLHRCRHGHRRQISYGNDMILHRDASTGDRQIPSWMTVSRPFSEVSRDDDHHHHHGHHHHEKGWFAKRINEFLNLF